MEELIFGILRYSISTKELGEGGGGGGEEQILIAYRIQP